MPSKKLRPIPGMLALLLALMSLPLQAQTPEEMGLTIAKEAERRADGFGDSVVTMQMILRSQHGEESTRELRAKTLEVANDGDKVLLIFDQPKDVQGTALLIFTHKTAGDDRWLFLPALKRIKRIASSNQSGAFMASEFSYEDISSQELEKYRYKWLHSETFEGQDCHVVERHPVDDSSGYQRQVMWMDSREYRPLRIDYYGRAGSLLKTLSLQDYRQYRDRFWRAHRLEMTNHLTGKSTTMLFKGYQLGSGLGASDFDQGALQAVK